MSDADDKGPVDGQVVEFDSLWEQSEVIGRATIDGISDALDLPPGKTSLMHVAGAGLWMVEHALRGGGANTPAMHWLLAQLRVLADAAELNVTEGPKAGGEYIDELRSLADIDDPQGTPPPHSLH